VPSDPLLLNQAQNALTRLMHRHQRGSFRIIRDPEGAISMWAIEGTDHGPFRVSFADQGRIGTRIEQMSPHFLKALVEYVNKTARS